MAVVVETTLGDLVIDLYTEERPKSTLNFLKLCKMKYYNHSLFHNVQSNFIAQTGDPTGTGRGGASIYNHMYGEQARYYDMEAKPRIKHTKPGLVSFINNGSNMHGSQFLITLAESLDFLDGKHTVFGEITEGLDIIEKLNDVVCNNDNEPYQDVRINHTVILDDPFDDPSGLTFPDRSPELTKEDLKGVKIAAHEKIDDTEGKTSEQVDKELADKELKIGTQILETIGDIADADLKPPDNVLFVCKLNPVTTAEDLEIIFSRFGTITSCEVIKDSKSGESLQYGFVEFEKDEDCEKAYFKMDNVLIDDRRIHVDFCQSVAKLQWDKSKFASKYSNVNIGEGIKLKKTENTSSKGYDMVFHQDDSKQSHSRKEKKKRHRSRSRSRDRDRDRSDRKRHDRHDSDHHRRKHKKHR